MFITCILAEEEVLQYCNIICLPPLFPFERKEVSEEKGNGKLGISL
jgi:hypothetical protein